MTTLKQLQFQHEMVHYGRTMFMVFHVTLYLSLKLMNVWWEICAIKLQNTVYECIGSGEILSRTCTRKLHNPTLYQCAIGSFSSSGQGNMGMVYVELQDWCYLLTMDDLGGSSYHCSCRYWHQTWLPWQPETQAQQTVTITLHIRNFIQVNLLPPATQEEHKRMYHSRECLQVHHSLWTSYNVSHKHPGPSQHVQVSLNSITWEQMCIQWQVAMTLWVLLSSTLAHDLL